MNNTPIDKLHTKRQNAIELYKSGMGIMAIVKESGLSYPSVRSAIDLYKKGGLAAIKPKARGRKVGSGRTLNDAQEQYIQKIIKNKSPHEFDLDYTLWSRPAIAALIQQELDLSITTRGVGNYLMRWGLNIGNKNPKNQADPDPADKFTWGPTVKRFGSVSQTQAGKTALRLKRDIITNNFQPGEKLTFEKLTKLYEVGSSPLREALFQVMGEGLVLSKEHKGFEVAPININEMLDISSLRAKMESIAITLSIQHGDEDWEARLISANYLLKKATALLHDESVPNSTASELWETRHRELHTVLCSACGSPWLMYFIGILYEHLERYRRYFWEYTKRAKGADYEHEQIVNAALSRNADKAVRLLHEHFKTQAELSLIAVKKED